MENYTTQCTFYSLLFFSQDILDPWLNLTLGIVTFVSSGFLIVTYIAWKQGRKTPGDIILALAISSFLISIYWLIFGVYYFVQSIPPSKNGDFCLGFAFIQTLGFSGQYIYNFSYCLTLRQAITNVLKVNTKFKLILQLVSTLAAFIWPIYFLSEGTLTINKLGISMCVFGQSTKTIVVQILLQFLYILQAIYTIWFFYRNVPEDSNTRDFKKNLLYRYVLYIASTIVMFLCSTMANIDAILASTNDEGDQDGIAVVIVGNLSLTIGPLILALVRLRNPAINRQIRKLFANVLIVQRNQEEEIEFEQLSIEKESSDAQFTQLQKNIRLYQIKSILNGIKYYYQNQNHFDFQKQLNPADVQNEGKVSSSSIPLLVNQINSFDSEYSDFFQRIGMDNDILNEEFCFMVNGEDSDDEEHEFKPNTANSNISTPQMYALSPQFFNLVVIYIDKLLTQLMRYDQIEMNAAHSFDIEKNSALIENMIGPDGGKSGEFFFFTHDNQWILKTLSEEELQAFRKRFPSYIYHMYQNRSSFINKIYGVFSIDMNQMQFRVKQQKLVYHMVLMRNLSQLERKYIVRTFDLKGSEFAREVLKPGKNNDQDSKDLSKMTLKDKDFETTEGKVFIDDELVDRGNFNFLVKQAMTSDARFFQKSQLMDYSLLIMKVNWGLYLLDHPEESIETVKNRFKAKKLQFLAESKPNEDNNGIYYHLSIIDYFQEWNLKKMTEKTSKQLMKLNYHLDTSAQNPDIYAERFIEQVVEKIFRKNE